MKVKKGDKAASADSSTKRSFSAADVASLTKEQKIALLQALEEKKRRKRDARSAFIPHAGQRRVIVSKAPKRIVVSGNGFGKTSLGVNEAMWAIEGYNPITDTHTAVPAKVIVVLDAPEKVSDVWLPELRKWRDIAEEQLHKRGKPYYTEITFPNGSVLRFMFHLQEPLAFESLSDIDLCVLDEPPPRGIWIALLRGGRQKNRKARYLLIGTPIAQAWLRQYYKDWENGAYPDTEFFKGSTKDNEANLAEGYIAEFSMHLTEAEKRTRLSGEFFNTDGMALAGLFKRDVHIVQPAAMPPEYRVDWPHVVSVDFHPSKPLYAVILASAPNGTRYYVGEFKEKVLPRQFARWLKQNWLVTHRVVDIVGDNYGSGDYTGGEGFRSAIDVMNDEGVRIRATSYDEKKDDEFLERLQDGLAVRPDGKCLLKFVAGLSDGVIKDIENVQWKKLKGSEEYMDKLEIGNTDYLACLKYALAANLTYDNAARTPKKTYQTRSSFMGKDGRIGRLEANWRRNQKDDDDW